MKTMEITEEVYSHRVEKRVKRHKCQRSAPFTREKTIGGLEKGLANLWSRRKITKKAHATVDKKPNGKSRLITRVWTTKARTLLSVVESTNDHVV
jgi:hypothetical protein